MQDRLVARNIQLENYAAAVRVSIAGALALHAARVGCAVEIPVGVPNHTPFGLCTISPAGEVVQHGLVSACIQPEDHAV